MPRDRSNEPAHQPEARFELIDGQFIVGNDVDGNRHVLQSICTGWGLEAVVPFASIEAWLHALRTSFTPSETPTATDDLEDWFKWAQAIEYHLPQVSAGPRDDRLHRGMCNRIRFGLLNAGHDSELGQPHNRTVMRLGNDGWMPDILFVGGGSLGRLREYFLDGPADIVVEVVLTGSEGRDRRLKRENYARGGVPEYWIVDPYQKLVEYLRLADGRFERQATASDGRYRPTSVPGLAVVTDRLWQKMDDLGWHVPRDDPPVFEVEEPHDVGAFEDCFERDGLGWGSVPYQPRISLKPTAMTFEQYISWCPAPKFEVLHGKPLIDGHPGTHNLIGFLLQSLGLIDAVKLAKPAEWIKALQQRRNDIAHDQQKRAAWWKEVKSAAAVLRDQFGFEGITVIGELIRERPLDAWSSVTLVVDRVPYGVSSHEAYRAIYDQNKQTCIHDLREYEHLNPCDRQEYERLGVVV